MESQKNYKDNFTEMMSKNIIEEGESKKNSINKFKIIDDDPPKCWRANILESKLYK